MSTMQPRFRAVKAIPYYVRGREPSLHPALPLWIAILTAIHALGGIHLVYVSADGARIVLTMLA